MSIGEMGALYVVATPIGNLDDLSRRASQVLSDVAIIACEDTRRTKRLLSVIGSSQAKLIALHDHNERDQVPVLMRWLRGGNDVALVSDAGTPLVSDPGFILLREAFEIGVKVIPVPGPSAVLAAVAASPRPVNRFMFEGFLPAKGAQRKELLKRWLRRNFATVFFEAPHRVRTLLDEFVELGSGDREIVVCRELTKVHEEIRVASAIELRGFVVERGEFVLILPGVGDVMEGEAPDWLAGNVANEKLLRALADEFPLSTAARLAARIIDRPKRELYAAMVSLTERG